ncbi:MAG TPA: competence/damage-inducible protein A [Firmicutes bacterium]|jgi:nicotinamide-nucleotide amidase|nr:competence/damage-inducible protein A [Bacillota bacterium]
MRGELIFVGTELLLGEILNTNAVFLAQELAALGVDVHRQTTVGDNLERLVEALREALQRVDLVITTGGLGPTEDDLTREAVALMLNRELVVDQDAMAALEEFFAQRGLGMPEANRKQALRPSGGVCLANPVGTAPGLFVPHEGKIVISLPGPPHEVRAVWKQAVAHLRRHGCGKQVIVSRSLRLCGIGESALVERISDLLAEQTNPTLAPLAALGEVRLRLTAKADDSAMAQRLLEPLEQKLRARLGTLIYGSDDETLEQVILDELRRRGATLASVESCTGGRLAGRLTAVPGASDVFVGGLVCYANRAKETLAGVPANLIRAHGAVSPQVAVALAEGGRVRLGTTLAVGITGVAGPGGGSPEKPVGLVHIAVAGPAGTKQWRRWFPGQRNEVRQRAVWEALMLLRKYILATEEGAREVSPDHDRS